MDEETLRRTYETRLAVRLSGTVDEEVLTLLLGDTDSPEERIAELRERKPWLFRPSRPRPCLREEPAEPAKDPAVEEKYRGNPWFKKK